MCHKLPATAQRPMDLVMARPNRGSTCAVKVMPLQLNAVRTLLLPECHQQLTTATPLSARGSEEVITACWPRPLSKTRLRGPWRQCPPPHQPRLKYKHLWALYIYTMRGWLVLLAPAEGNWLTDWLDCGVYRRVFLNFSLFGNSSSIPTRPAIGQLV